jgi:chemotaxis protein CheZ
MNIHLDPTFLKLLQDLEARGTCQPSHDDIMKAVTEVLYSLDKGLNFQDFKLYGEIEKIQRFIDQAKRDLSDLQPHDISKTYIPTAKDELSAVVEATEEATGTILDATEAIESMMANLPKEMQNTLQEHITQIYEACNFQDITGQRIKKVTSTLKYIDEKISGILETFKASLPEEIESQPSRAQKPAPSQPKEEDKYLNGPQLPDHAKSQDDIDALFAS